MPELNSFAKGTKFFFLVRGNGFSAVDVGVVTNHILFLWKVY